MKIPVRSFSIFAPLALLGVALAAETAPASPEVLRAPVPIKRDGESLYALGFDRLSAFPYTIVDAGTGATPEEIAEARKRDQVPDWIRFYDGKKVLLTGYLMPLQLEGGRAKKFVMMKDITTCCYGAVPNMNDYVVVTMKGDPIEPVTDVPVQLIGVLRIEEKFESGYITALFSMDGEKFFGAKK
jgi:hypothetical protein